MRTPSQQGYTILEIMIFIGISASIFFIAMTALAGRQQQVQFTQAVRDLDSQLQDVMNDISTGFFENAGVLSCTVTGSNKPVVTTGTDNQGASDDCIFVGKALQFGPDLTNGGQADENTILIHTLVGRRFAVGGGDVSSIAEAQPVGITPTAQLELKWGLKVKKVVTKAPVTEHGMLAFYTSFARSVGGNQLSNAQQVQASFVSGTSYAQTESTGTSNIDALSTSSDPTKEIVLCLADADEARTASITLVNEGSARTDTQLDIYDPECDT